MGGKPSTMTPQEQERKEGNFPTVESWNDADAKLVVTQPEGWSCKISLQTRIKIPPSELYDLLTTPDNTAIFRNLEKVKRREVVEDDNRGKQLISIRQEGRWRFLCFSGTLDTDLWVKQNRRTGEIDFKLKEPGLMKKFEGRWLVQPFNQDSLDHYSGFATHNKHPWFAGPGNALLNLRKGVGRRKQEPESSWLTLEQSILPSKRPPKALEGIIKGISARQVRNMVEDVRREADKRNIAKGNRPPPSSSAAPIGNLLIFGPIAWDCSLISSL